MDKAPFSSHVLCSRWKIDKLFSAAVLLRVFFFFFFSLKEKNIGGVCPRRLFNHTLSPYLSTRQNWSTVLNSLQQDPPYSFPEPFKMQKHAGNCQISWLINDSSSKYTRNEILPRAVGCALSFRPLSTLPLASSCDSGSLYRGNPGSGGPGEPLPSFLLSFFHSL